MFVLVHSVDHVWLGVEYKLLIDLPPRISTDLERSLSAKREGVVAEDILLKLML